MTALTPTPSLNGTGTTKANLTTNQNQTVLARVPKVTEGRAVDISHTLYIQVLFIVLFGVAMHISTYVCFFYVNSKYKN